MYGVCGANAMAIVVWRRDGVRARALCDGMAPIFVRRTATGRYFMAKAQTTIAYK